MRAAVLLSLALLCGAAKPPSQWETLSPVGEYPVDISGHVMVAIPNGFFVFSGHQEIFDTLSVDFFNDVYLVDLAANTWTKKATPGPRPAPRVYASAVYSPSNRLVYVFGGSTFNNFYGDFIAFDDLWTYSIDTDTWTEITFPSGSNLPTERAACLFVIASNQIYLFGGVTPSGFFYEVLNDMWRFDTTSSTWTQLIVNGDASAPPARQIPVGGYLPMRNSIIMNGGEFLEGFSFMEARDTWIYSINSNTWEDVTPSDEDNLLPARNYVAGGVFANRFVLYGGDSPGGSSGCGSPFGFFSQNVQNDTWVYDPRPNRGTWELVETANNIAPKKRAGSTILTNRLCQHGGYDFICDENDIGPGQVFPPGQDIYCLKISNI